MLLSEISAVLLTKGDRDISPVLESLKGFDELIIWDNSKREDFKVMGRYLGAAGARNETVYVQDDDCIVDAVSLISLYSPGQILVNMPADRRNEYLGTGISLIGWGCIFPRDAISTMFPYVAKWGCDELFYRECDRVFTYLNQDRIRHVEVPFRQLPYAFGDDRMGKEARHREDFMEIRRRLASLETARRSA